MQEVTVTDFIIVIPAYNEEEYIGNTLDALYASCSKLPPDVSHRVVVVDDECTDKTAEVATRRGALVVSGNRTGIGAARNRGAGHVEARKAYVFLDADTVAEADVIPAINESLDAGALYGSVVPIYSSQVPSIKLLLKLWAWYAPRRKMAQGVCQFFRPEVFFELDGYDPGIMMAEDTDLNRRALTAFGESRRAVIVGPYVHPSMRRYEKWGGLRSWIFTNPLTTKFRLRDANFWKHWYVDPPR